MGIVTGMALLTRALTLLFVAVVGVRVSTTTGETIEGEWRGVSQSAVLVDVDGEQREFAFDDLVDVVSTERDEEAIGPDMRVSLLGGSKIAAQDLTLADETLTVEPRRQGAVVVPLREVKSIRFRAPSPATDAQWLGLLENEDRRDRLAIRRSGNQIDPAPVIVESIADGKVGFNIEGQSGAAPLGKLEGVVFGGNRPVAESAEVQIVDVYGSRWLVRAIEPSDGKTLKLKLSDTVSHELPVKHLYSMSWSSGLVMLAAQDPAESRYQPPDQFKLDPDDLKKWFGPQSSSDANLVMVGGSSIEYRIEGDLTTLAGSVRRDRAADQAGNVAVAISLDDREVWKKDLNDSASKGFEIPLNGARRLRIEVLSGADGDVGDIVEVVRPRLLK